MKLITEWCKGVCHAHLLERPEVRGKGPTPDAAIGNLIATHPDLFAVEIVPVEYDA